jgi:hypothetical protein
METCRWVCTKGIQSLPKTFACKADAAHLERLAAILRDELSRFAPMLISGDELAANGSQGGMNGRKIGLTGVRQLTSP